ncbi:hypothetical protein EVAR_66277_1 [Eumeta japonica]|uniref:Uncharacterized protein n=1 Tax=Eumeta variegata TaxID=151549 RepID=A0A4C1YV42_EUMVA|nr:hypothetical protein EVAR_66277_1 [Eumeta japonica]
MRSKRSLKALGTIALHTGLTDEGWGTTVIYSDDLGVGLDMLGNRVGHQAMNNKEVEIELFMDRLNVDILSITEHWLRNGQILFDFPNHQVASSFSRENSSHGGSSIVIRVNLEFKKRTDIVDLSAERVVKIICVELERLIVMSVFRPPHSSYEFLNRLWIKPCVRKVIEVNIL